MIAELRKRLGWFEERGATIGSWPSERSVTLFNVLQILVISALGGWAVLKTGHFTYDQAYFYELSVRVAERLHPAAYGPFVSGDPPVALTPGGLMYDVLALPFLFARDPRVGVVWIQVLATAGFLLFDRFLRLAGAPAALRLVAVTLAVGSLRHLRLTSTFWNADLFLFASPALLYVALRWAQGRPAWSAAFGALAAFALQTHLSGALIVGAAALIVAIKGGEGRVRVPSVALAVGVFALCYVPFVAVEARDGAPDLHLLFGRAVPQRLGLSWKTLRSCLAAPVLAAAHPQELWQMLPQRGDWIAWAIALSAWVAVPAAVLGLWVRFTLKPVVLATLLALPLFFALVHRPYFEHYVAAVTPVMVLLPAAGIAALLSRPDRFRYLAVGYLCAHSVVALALVVTQSRREIAWAASPYVGLTVPAQLAATAHDLSAPLPPVSKAEDEKALVKAVLAKRILGRELEFRVESKRCRVEIALSGIDPPLRVVPPIESIVAGPNSVLLCH